MCDPLAILLVESEGIYIIQADLSEPVSRWYGTEHEAWDEAERLSLALGKTVYVFRAIAKVEIVEKPVKRTILAAHGPARDT